MALTDPLQWITIVVVVVLVTVIAFYLLVRIIQTLAKADRVFDAKGKESTPSSGTIPTTI